MCVCVCITGAGSYVNLVITVTSDVSVYIECFINIVRMKA